MNHFDDLVKRSTVTIKPHYDEFEIINILNMVWPRNLQLIFYEIITFNPRSFRPGPWSIGWTGPG